jgi:hypothetical protein
MARLSDLVGAAGLSHTRVENVENAPWAFPMASSPKSIPPRVDAVVIGGRCIKAQWEKATAPSTPGPAEFASYLETVSLFGFRWWGFPSSPYIHLTQYSYDCAWRSEPMLVALEDATTF